jgi:uncharacterized protein YndB with AHSA1/START domain
MTSSPRPGPRILGSLRSAGGKGVVRIEDSYGTGIDDLWQALTDPDRLASWYGQVEGDLRPGGQFRLHVEDADSDATGRVEACEPPQRLQVMTRETEESYQRGQGVPPYDEALEATLTADGGQTILVIEVRGMPLDAIASSTGSGGRSMPRISPPISPGARAATPRRDGTISSPPTRSWLAASASSPILGGG